MKRLLAFLCVLFLLAGCDEYPKDPDDSLRAIRTRGEMRIGVIAHRPYAYDGPHGPAGVEVELAKGFAAAIGVKPLLHVMSEAEALDGLCRGMLDMAVGGLTADNPRASELGLTRPYLKDGTAPKDHHVLAVPAGENRLLVTLETYLRDKAPDVRAAYERAMSREARP